MYCTQKLLVVVVDMLEVVVLMMVLVITVVAVIMMGHVYGALAAVDVDRLSCLDLRIYTECTQPRLHLTPHRPSPNTHSQLDLPPP